MLKRIIKKIINILKPYTIINKKNKLKIIFKDINLNKFNTVIIFENTFGWDKIMRQRPQQIALNMPDNVLFLYHSNKDKYDNLINYKKIKNNLYMINLDLYRKHINKYLHRIRYKYVMIYSTNNISNKIINNYSNNNFKIIYEYIDNFDEELSGKKTVKRLLKIYNKIIKMENTFIICTANNLYNNVLKDNPKRKAKLITNGCDYNHFSKKINDIPKEMEKIKKSNKPMIGYYGAFASWFDYDLIKEISKINKYEIVLIGIKYDNSLEKSSILKFNNVHYLGEIDYDELPKYSNQFDIAIIPFIINDITLSTSPIKVFEYMASKKPIVTTNLPECKKYQSILISENYEDFIKNIDKAYKLKNDSDYLVLLYNDALNNTWEKKCQELILFVNEG